MVRGLIPWTVAAVLLNATLVPAMAEKLQGGGTTLEDFAMQPETRWRFFSDQVMGGVSTGAIAFDERVRRELELDADPRTPVCQLRVGAQQVVEIAKAISFNSRVIIMDEPTRGVDVGAKAEIYRIMRQLADRGLAVLMISSEMPELLGMCDRIYVMNDGRLVAEMPAKEASQEKIMRAIMKSWED